MKKQTATAVAAVLLLLVSAVGTGAAVAPNNSAAAEFDSSTTSTDTVVVAIGAPGTDEGEASLGAANAIANEHNYTVVRVPEGTLPPSVVQTLSQRVQHGDLRNAIVVGVGDNSTERVATALTAVGHDGTTLTVEDQITGDSPSDLLYRASLQSWDSSDAAYVTTFTNGEPAKVSLAVANESAGAAPVLAQSMGYADLNATLQHLGVSTVYVSPGVSDSTRNDLQNDGYTVDSSPGGVSLDQSMQKISVGYTGDKTEDVVIVGEQNHVYTASQVGAANNSTVIITENSSVLGDNAETQLNDLTDVDDVYVVGNDDDITDSVFSNISNTVRSSADITRVNRVHGYTETYLRTSILVSGYEYGVLTSHTNETGDNVTVDVTNIGYSTVLTVDNTSVTATFDGDIDGSSPAGSAENDQWVVTNDDSMDPDDTFEVELDANSVENGGHPALDYYVGSSGALIGSSGGLGFFFEQVQGFADWLFDKVSPLLPDLPVDTTNPLVMGVVLIATIVVGLGVVIAFRSGLRTFKDDRRASAHGTQFGVFGAEMGLGQWGLRAVLLIGAIILAIPSDPITDTAGWIGGAVILAEIALNQR